MDIPQRQTSNRLNRKVKKYFATPGTVARWWNPESPYYNRQLKTVETLIQPARQLVLDVAAGKGRFAIHLAAAGAKKVVALDISWEMISIAKQRVTDAGFEEKVLLCVADAESLPFRSDMLDSACCMEVLVHLPNPVNALRELNRVVRDGGVIVSNVDTPAPWWRRIYLEVQRLILAPAYFGMPDWLRRLLSRLMGLPLSRKGKVLRKLKSVDKVLEYLQKHPQAYLSRPNDAIYTMSREYFLDLVKRAELYPISVNACGLPWAPFGYIVAATNQETHHT